MAKTQGGNIRVQWDHVLDEVQGDQSGVTGVRIRHARTGATQELALQGVFIAIGHKPNTDLFAGQLEMNNGYIKTRSGLEAMPLRPIFRVCLPPAMCRIMSIVRQSPALAPDAWPHSMRSAISRHSRNRELR